MTAVWVLAAFLLRDLGRSLAVIVPLATALAFGLIAFEYGMDQDQFITVAGVATAALCGLNGMLLAGRADRATSYPIVGRLRQRSQLLFAIVGSSLALTCALALLITIGNLLAGRLTLNFPSILWVVPTWLPLWLLAACLALPLSALTSRGGSHLVGWVLLAAILVAHDQRARLRAGGLDGPARAVEIIVWPVTTLLAQASADTHSRAYLLALGLTLAYAALLFVLAAQAFEDKDLLWPG
ncbi:MAG: hypothetical protein PVG11_05525 [Anaerolineae bacterium]|jgi:hypothetical protein